ncbi:MAG: NADH-quinone oxidoreductase subunit M, partial [Methylotenera sp.]
MDFLNSHVLSFSIWLPILAGVVVLLLGNDNKPNFTRLLALVLSLAAFAVTLPLYTHFNYTDGGFQFQEMAR